MAGLAEEITASALAHRHVSRSAAVPGPTDEDGEALGDDKPPDAFRNRGAAATQPKSENGTGTAVSALGGLTLSFSAETVAGTSAGIIGKVVEHPLDTVKTRLQERPTRYPNPHSALLQIVRMEGGSGLFKGISAPLAAAACEQGATFTLYANVLAAVSTTYALERPSAYSSEGRAAAPLRHHAIAGAATGAVCATFVTPVEYLKCRMQQCCGRRLTMRELLSGGGWRHLFNGHTATLARDVPGTAAWFVGYESALRSFDCWDRRSATEPGRTPSDPSAARISLAGGFAGVMFATAFFPADVVKTRMQLDREFCRRGLWSGLRTIVKEDGVRALFKGWSCTALSAFPANAAVFLTYETVIAHMDGGKP